MTTTPKLGTSFDAPAPAVLEVPGANRVLLPRTARACRFLGWLRNAGIEAATDAVGSEPGASRLMGHSAYRNGSIGGGGTLPLWLVHKD